MRQVSFLIKPASSLCNLRCRYCFYADEAAKRNCADMGCMTEATAELLLREAFALTAPPGAVHFLFQGGEPTLAGLGFFRFFVSRARALCPPGVKLSFSLQTNATLLDEAWARFLREERFLVGISLDGTAAIHNAHRVDAMGKGSWNRAKKGLELLLREKVSVNALCVVTGICARSPQKVYQSLKALGFSHMQFIACLDPLDETPGSRPWSLRPDAYGSFLCRLFDLWYSDWQRGSYHSIRLFEDHVRLLLGEGSSTCATCGQCGGHLVVEGDGSVYPCDFYALDAWKMGVLGQQSLRDMIEGEVFRRFLLEGQRRPEACSACGGQALCAGGCRRDRIRTADGMHNIYCSAFRRLFDHAGPRLQQLAQAAQSLRRP